MSEINVKFPSTPHFAISVTQDIRNDKVLDDDMQNDALTKELIIEEKIDGANLGISFDSEGNIILQNRGSILNPPFSGQWKPLDNWLKSRLDKLFDVLTDRYILFGEWCYAKHSIHYTSLPDYFLAFDIYDKNLKKFIDFDRRQELTKSMDILSVPLLGKGFFRLNELPSFIKKSLYSDSISEGVYVRASDSYQTFFRAKIVRNDFTQNIALHWSARSIIKNSLLINKCN